MQKLLTKLLVCIVLLTVTITEIASAQLPTVTSVNPMAANPGATVTLTGTNFNTTPANNIVYFGATRATVTAASTTTLTATVPIGATYNHISVNNTASALTGYSQYPFLPTFDNSIFLPGPISFASQVTFATGTQPRGSAIGDIDGDGKPDIVIANSGSATVSVYRNTSSSGSITSGSFATAVTFAVGNTPTSVGIGDIDGDGKPDLVVSNGGSSNSISVLRNTSISGSITSGSFATHVTFATGTAPYTLAIGDIDGDGKLDVAVPNYSSNTVSVLRNTSSSGSITSGSFATQVSFATGANPFCVAIGDIDGDGKPDMAVANAGSGSGVSVYRNISTTGSITTGSFATPVTYGSSAFSVALADIDGDGKQDMVVANGGSTNVLVYRNTSSSGSITTGSFASAVTFATGSAPYHIAIGDINGDGKPDMAVANMGSASVSVLRNTSTSGSITSGSFATQVTYATGTNPPHVSMGDLDGDGLPDIVVPNMVSNTVSVIRNNPLFLPPTVTAVTPNIANPGATVTLTGTNFNTTPANNIVYFGATRATVTAASTTTLTATVPSGATYNRVSVNNTASALTGYSQYPFLPTFDNSIVFPGPISFASQVTFATGSNPRGSAIGDLDGDGKPDIVVTNVGSASVSVYRNTSSSGSITSGSFAAAVTFATGNGPMSVGIGDIDGDGKPELVVSNGSSNSISVLRNTSTSGSITSGSFATHVTFATGAFPHNLALGDIDGDGKLDVAVPNYSSNTVSVLRNTSSSGSITSGSFATQVAFATGANPLSAAIGDIDGDGKLDMAVTNPGAATVSVYRNTSSSGSITSGSFAIQVTFATGGDSRCVALGDIDGDGKQDMAVANGTGTASVFRNTSSSGSITSGSFASAVTFAAGTTPFDIAIGDINGDGKPDMAVANMGSANVSVLRNTSTSGSITSGSFATQVTLATGNNAHSVAIGDLDGDGLPDIVAPNMGSNTVSVIRNNPTLLTKVTSVSPTAASPGATVTLTGNGFNTTPANNIVYFGATRATVTASGTTTLTATVPVGATYKEVSVNNTATALTGYSQYPFLPTFDNSAVSPLGINFASQVAFAAGTTPQGSAIGDLDGDGKPDMVVANYGSNTISVYRNTSSSGSITSGSFATQVTFATGTNPWSVAIGDIDGDGKPEIVVANIGSNTVSVYRNTSSSGSITSGSFASQITFATGTNPTGVAIGDIDGDGKSDIAVVNYGGGSVSVLRNTSTIGSITSGSFATHVTFATAPQPFCVTIGDIDGDGKPDMAVASYNTNAVAVHRNTSTSGSITSGSFAAPVSFAAGGSPSSVALSDIDGDGKPDMAVANRSSNTVSVYRNTSTSGSITSGSFATEVAIATGAGPVNLAMADINGDGKPDMAVANSNSNTVSVYSNTSSSGSITSGSFATPVAFATGNSPQSIAIGDMDGDNLPDIISANYGSATVSVIRNSPTFLPTTVTSVNPTTANPGATVTLTGTIFSNIPANNIVYFGATRATVTASSTTTLTATVPVGASYNNVSVNNAISKLTGYSQYPFLPKYDNSAFVPATLNFNSTYTYGANTQAYDVATGDIDGDGKADLVVANYGTNNISVYRNTSTSGSLGAGSFATKVDFAVNVRPVDIALADIDGDGKLDVIVPNNGSGNFSVLRNTATSGVINSGSFATKVDITAASSPAMVAVADIDGDGKLDVAVTNSASNSITLHRNTGTAGSISFASSVSVTGVSNPVSIVLTDIDGDSKPDMVSTNYVGNTVAVFRNTATAGVLSIGSFASAITFATGASPWGLREGDVDGDGKTDLIVTNNNGASISILRNTATSGSITSSSFAAKVDFTTGTAPFHVDMGDLDGDGKADIALSSFGANNLSVFRNTSTSGTISMAARLDFPSGASTQIHGIAVGDLDGDGMSDVASTNFGTATIGVFRNNPLRPITGAAQACVGSTITLANATSGGTWSSSNTAVATVGSLTGVVTGLSGGTVTITYAGSAGASFAGNSVTTVVTVIAAPSITSVSPNAANPGAAVTITGTGFNTTAGNNIVYFGATRATVTAASTTSLTATVPVGATYKQVSVMNNICPLTGFTQYPFLPTFDNSATNPSTISMAPQVTFATGTQPIIGSAIGDLDGDGKPDLVVANAGSDNVSVYRNISSSGSITSGSFATAVTFATGDYPMGVAIGDIDGDGKPDLVVSNNSASGTISVLRNTSSIGSITSGSFASQVTFAAGVNPYILAIGDLDGDGKLDVAVPNHISNTVSVLRNTSTSGTITFATQVTFATGTNPRSVAIGDIDGDGKPDMAVTNRADGTVSVYRNTSSSGSITSGSFAAQVTFSAGFQPFGVAFGDIDGDGKQDMAVATASNIVSVYRNISSSGSITSASFASQVTFATGVGSVFIAIGDINGDGKPDMATANANANTISVLRNTSSSGSITSGSFAAHVSFAAGANPHGIAIGDLDGDGLPDIVAPNFGSPAVSVFRNSPTFLPTTVTSVNPTTANPGATVTITGTRFNATPANNIVYFGATRATVTASSTTTLTATVPSGASYNNVSVNNSMSKLTGYSQYPFLPKYDNSAFVPATLNFNSTYTYGANTQVYDVATGDIDGDGKADLVVANYGTNNISVYRNTSTSGSIGAGSFATKVDFAVNVQPVDIALADIDGDGKLDVIVPNNGSGNFSVLRNTATSGVINSGSFATKVDITAASSPAMVAVADIDGDGKLDVAVTNSASNSITLHRNTGTAGSISFASSASITGVSNPVSIVLTDIDGDSKPDMVSTNYVGNTVAVFRNTATAGVLSSGSFASAITFATGASPWGLREGDVDGDGKTDLIVTNNNGASISILRNTATSGSITSSSFAAKVDFTTGAAPFHLDMGDLDGDGKADIALASFSANNLSVFRNTSTSGTISMATRLDFPSGASTQIHGIAVGDLDGDGMSDVASTNFGTASIGVFRNNALQPITGTATVCVGNTSTLSSATAGGTWISSNPAVGSISSSGVVTGVTGGTITITYAGTAASGPRLGNYTTYAMSVNATPVMTVTPTVQTVCNGANTTAQVFTSSVGGTTYAWNNSNTSIGIGASGTGSSISSFTGTNTGATATSGVFTVIPTAAGCVGATRTFTVTVNPSANPGTISGTASIFTSETTTLTASGATGGTWSSTNTAVGTVSTSGVVTGVSAGTTTISYTVTNSCGSASATITVTVNSALVTPITGTLSVCMGSTTTLSNATSGGSWSSSNTLVAAVNAAGVVTGVSAGTAEISYTLSGTSVTAVVTVNPLPDAGTISGTASVCPGGETTFSTTSTMTGSWSSTNTAVGTVAALTGAFTGSSVGTTTISYTVTNSCGTVASTIVATVNPLPVGGTITGASTVNEGATITLSNTSAGGTWSSSDIDVATVGSTGIVTGVSSGIVVISYTVTNICGSATATKTVTVNAALGTPITGTLTVCVGSITSLSNATSGGTWSSSNTLVAAVNTTGVVTGVTAGTSVISYTLSGTSATAVVTVNAAPDAGTITGTANVCAGNNITLNNATTGGTWSSTDTDVATIGTSGVVSGLSAGTTTISYAVSNGCGTAASTRVITVNPLPNAGTITGASTVNEGSSITLANATTGGVWSSSDVAVATVGSTGVVTGVSAGVVSISYTVTNSCGSATATITVTVNAALGTPITGTLTVCEGSTTSLSNATSGGTWSSSNTLVAAVNTTGVVTGVTAGTSVISYTLSGISVTAVVTVNAAPVVGAISGLSSVCAGSNITLNNATTGGTWSSTDTDVATIGTSGVVSGLSAGTTTISYAVSNGCGTVASTRVITVNPLPNAGTITGASTVNEGSSITLANATTGGVWSSSDVAVATVGSTGVVTGVSAGVVSISYTVTNSCGSATPTKTVTVNAALGTPITGTLTVCEGSTTSLSNATSGGTWSSSNTVVAAVNTTGVVTGINAGTSVISYTISGTSVTAIVTVNALPVAGTLSGATTVCVGNTATVNKTGTGGEWSSSATAIATVGTTGIVTGLTEGTTTISYTVTNSCGSVAATRVVTVIATPVAGTISGSSSVCSGGTTTLNSTIAGGTWSSSYPASATVNGSTGLVTGVTAGAFTISYRITTSCGTANATFPISVINAPVLGAISGATSVCEAATTTLANTTNGGTWSSTNTAAATIDASSGAATGVAAGTTTISYTVTNTCGTATVSRILTVNPLPIAAVISGTTSVSVGTTTTLTATPSGGTWLSASGTIASVNAGTGVATGMNVGVATVSYTRTNSCGSVVTTVAVTVTGAITPITGTRVVCQGATTSLGNSTAGGTWSAADGAIATIGTTGIVTGVSAGTTTVTYTFSGGGNVTATVTVNAAPAVYTGSGFVCTGSQLNLGSIIPGCTWTSGNTARATVVSATGIVTGGATLGTVNISYTNAATCRTVTQLTVNAGVGATTGISSPCIGGSFTALNSTPGGTWSSSNTARATIDASSGLLTAVGSGTVTISYTLSTGCVRTTTVTLGTPPAITGNPSICFGQTSTLVSSGGTWSSSNASIASVVASGIVTGVSLGNAVITYRSTANALCFVTQPVTVNPVPSTIVAPPALCPGQTATLTSLPAGGTWTSTVPANATVDPSTGVVTAVIFNYSTISAVNITYTLPTGCGGIATVTINPLPSPIGGNRNICQGSTTTLTSSTAGSTWSSASPAIATAAAGGVVTGVSAGLATISYTNALGCANTAEITVNAMPGANTGSASLCLPTSATSTLSNPAGAGTWSSNNTTKATVNFSSGLVTGINTGTANITYTKAAGCISVTQVTVTICGARPGATENPEATNVFSVSPNPTTGAINLTTSILGKVEIYTIDGKLLEQYEAKAGTTSISLPSGIASGVYMLRFNGMDGSSKMVRLVYQQ